MFDQIKCEIFTHNFTDASIVQAIETCCSVQGLQITLKGTLKQYPDCIHWHLKNATQRGTLEITFWPAEHHVWFKVNASRSAEWIADAAARLCESIETALQST